MKEKRCGTCLHWGERYYDDEVEAKAGYCLKEPPIFTGDRPDEWVDPYSWNHPTCWEYVSCSHWQPTHDEDNGITYTT